MDHRVNACLKIRIQLGNGRKDAVQSFYYSLHLQGAYIWGRQDYYLLIKKNDMRDTKCNGRLEEIIYLGNT